MAFRLLLVVFFRFHGMHLALVQSVFFVETIPAIAPVPFRGNAPAFLAGNVVDAAVYALADGVSAVQAGLSARRIQAHGRENDHQHQNQSKDGEKTAALVLYRFLQRRTILPRQALLLVKIRLFQPFHGHAAGFVVIALQGVFHCAHRPVKESAWRRQS